MYKNPEKINYITTGSYMKVTPVKQKEVRSFTAQDAANYSRDFWFYSVRKPVFKYFLVWLSSTSFFFNYINLFIPMNNKRGAGKSSLSGVGTSHFAFTPK